MAASSDAGAKHVVSHFLTSDGQCKLTLMIAERSRDEKDEFAAQDLRLLVMVAAGRTARLDAGEGKALEFACKGDAQAMTATAVDRVRAQSHGEIILARTPRPYHPGGHGSVVAGFVRGIGDPLFLSVYAARSIITASANFRARHGRAS